MTRSLDILSVPSGSSVGPGVFVYNWFSDVGSDGTSDERAQEDGAEDAAVDRDESASDE